MLTLDQLCAEMECSGHHLTPRAARDWWTKGLLPRPQRRGLGRGKGTLTYWTNRRILEQAQAVDDLLGHHSRAYTAIIGLWLWGFSVDLKLVRSSYLKLIDRYLHPSDPLEDWIVDLAPKAARRMTEPGTPQRVREKLTDVISEFLNAFFGIEEISVDGIAEYWAVAALYIQPKSQQQPEFSDENFEWLIGYLRGWASLLSQREALLSAIDNELMRARRVIRLAFGCLARLIPPDQKEAFEAFGHSALIAFGRPMLPILVRVLREPQGQEIVRHLLQFASFAKREGGTYFPSFAEGPLPLALQDGKG